jgi:Zn-finger nucleic acid-binding protein
MATDPPRGPYRANDAPSSEAGTLKCPVCGAPCASGARQCPHCDVELASVRCKSCFALHFSGSRYCTRCGLELEGTTRLDATDAPCPRCQRSLRVSAEAQGAYECVACGGLFVDHASFARLASEKEHERTFVEVPRSVATTGPDAEVHYLKCPMCDGTMNRTNFGRRSNVIVDVCKKHGTWFDSGELTRVLEWIASGAHLEERRRQLEESEQEKAKARVARVTEVLAPRTSSHDPEAPGRDSLLNVLFDIFRTGL